MACDGESASSLITRRVRTPTGPIFTSGFLNGPLSTAGKSVSFIIVAALVSAPLIGLAYAWTGGMKWALNFRQLVKRESRS